MRPTMSRDLVFTLLLLGAKEYDFRAVDLAVQNLTQQEDIREFYGYLTALLVDHVEMEYKGKIRSREIDESYGLDPIDVAMYMAEEMIYERLPHRRGSDLSERLVLARWSSVVRS